MQEFEYSIEKIDFERCVIDVLFIPANEELRHHRIKNIGIEEKTVDAYINGEITQEEFSAELERQIILTSNVVQTKWHRQLRVMEASGEQMEVSATNNRPRIPNVEFLVGRRSRTICRETVRGCIGNANIDPTNTEDTVDPEPVAVNQPGFSSGKAEQL